MAPQGVTTPSLSHSDVHSLLSIITMRLGERNFIKWSFQFQSTLAGNGLFGFYDGSEVAPPRYVLTSEFEVTKEETTAYRAWKQTDMALLSLLMATLDEDIVDVIIGCKTSRQAWIALQERFSAVSRVSIMQLKTELQTLRKGSETIEKYLQRVKNARDQLLSVGVSIPDEDIIIVILNGLPDEYSTIRTVVEGRETPISLRDLRSQLLAAERRLEGSFSLLSTMSAMLAQGGETRTGERDGSSRGWDNKGGGKNKDVKYNGNGVECSVCGKKGHTVDTCFRVHKCQICGKHGHLTSTCYQNPDYKPQQTSQSQFRPSSIVPSPECQICSKKGHTAANCFYRTNVPEGHPSLSIPTCQICGLKGHVALNCSHRTNFAYQGSDPPASLAALTAQSTGSVNGVFHQTQGGGCLVSNGSSSSCFPGGFHPSSDASSSNNLAAPSNTHSNSEIWIGDSGATHHMTSKLRNLTIAQPYSSDNKITIGQGIQNSSLSRKE
ncbi:putative RNA-directed DNA polymerase [Rosa chinensis]|uniref:Putative RNA-directed DNA polymerase n=1 Tax=Rosa chinensis TaxID=74649 RepID=A0A2P6RE28_ROSCH|nr:putative RNA-directed DNA polymerase [Rosa chinensis]